jgi:hypothetical protein
MRRTVPGADHAIATGTRNQRLRPMLDRPAATEIAKTQDEKPAFEIPIASAALK